MDPSLEKVMEYCAGIANEFFARLNRIRIYVPDHKLTSGTANETILRNFLSDFSAERYKIGQGFICEPTFPEHASNQCDIIVYDSISYPPVDQVGEIKVVRPRSVRMLIEVKTNLDKKRLCEALTNIASAKALPYMNNAIGVIFAYQSNSIENIVKHLREFPFDYSMEVSPMAILLLDKGAIIHRWGPIGILGIDSIGINNDLRPKSYLVRKSNEENLGAVVIAFLLLFFFEAQLGSEAMDTANILNRMLGSRTEEILQPFQIGDNYAPQTSP